MSRFNGKLTLVLLDDKEHGAVRAGRSLWAIEHELTYRTGDGDGELIIVHPGMVTDLASIPRLVWSFYPPDGPWVKGAVIHDFLYATRGTGNWKTHTGGITRARPYSRAEADGILREAMFDRGVGVVERTVIWLAVRLGGWGGWGR